MFAGLSRILRTLGKLAAAATLGTGATAANLSTSSFSVIPGIARFTVPTAKNAALLSLGHDPARPLCWRGFVGSVTGLGQGGSAGLSSAGSSSNPAFQNGGAAHNLQQARLPPPPVR